MLLGLFGLVGGVLAFGLIGLLPGPTLLAVAYNLLLEWVATELEERTLSASPSVAADHTWKPIQGIELTDLRFRKRSGSADPRKRFRRHAPRRFLPAPLNNRLAADGLIQSLLFSGQIWIPT